MAKQWKIMKRLPTKTLATHWHLRINDVDYVATVADCRRMGWFTSAFKGTKSGHIADWSPIVNMQGDNVTDGIDRLLEKLNIEHTMDDIIIEVDKVNEKFHSKHPKQ